MANKSGFVTGLQKNGSSTSILRQNLRKLILLQILCLVQGIRNGILACVPILLAAHGVSYTQQAVFSFSSWPYSTKLILAPVIDATYLRSLGRRRSWFIPLQLLAALFFFVLSSRIDGLLDNKSVGLLTVIFFLFSLIFASGDIVVDAWALKLLPKEIIGYSSICNRIGHHSGKFLGFAVYMALESPTFCNRFLRWTPSDVGLVTFSGFLWFWGCVCFTTAAVVLIFVKEEAEEEEISGILNTYKLLVKISFLPAIRTLCFILLTCNIGVGAAETIASFKLLQQGISKDRVTLLLAPCIPFRALYPVLVSRYTTGPKSLKLFENCYIPRLVAVTFYAMFVYASPYWLNEDKTFSVSYFLTFCLVDFVYSGLAQTLTLCMMSWFNRVSDPSFGATYMTLLNTFQNFGLFWPNALALWGIDHFSVTECKSPDVSCDIILDGYYIEMGIFVVLGVLWLTLMRKKLRSIQMLPDAVWRPSVPHVL